MASRLMERGDERSLRVLEFDRVLAAVGARAVSAAGRARVAALRPLPNVDAAAEALAAVVELRAIVEAPGGWTLGPIPDLGAAVARLAVPEARLEAAELLACAEAMAAGRKAGRLVDRLEPGGLAARWAGRLWGDRALEARIRATFDEAGGVADGASPELRRIRRSLARRRSRLVDDLTAFARTLPERARVPDASVTLRGGRYCVPVRREGKALAGGLVHDASASRRTLFVEPARAIEAMNDIRELELRETREVDRILRERSAAVRERRHELRDSYGALIELDSLRARALFASDVEGEPPTFAADAEAIRARGARHPLLSLAPSPTLPFDSDTATAERVLLVSGPNAGGKTVFLKTLGLACALAQSGVIPPLGPGSRLPFFRRIFATIGDEQSIDASLSTFGAQALNLARVLAEAGGRDFVLFDEIGSATDPAEGGALAAAALRRLAGQARLTVATTHLGDLKRLGDEGAAAVNASLEFDGRRLEPTYRLVRDRPGRSYALVIAARLGVPEDVLAEARERLGPEHVSVDDMLARMEAERAEAEELRERLEARAAESEERERTLAAREAVVAASERETERRRATALREALREARRQVESAIGELDSRYGELNDAARREARRAARSGVERALRAATRAVREQTEERDPVAGDAPRSAIERPPRVGDLVRWGYSPIAARVLEVRGARAAIEQGGLRVTVPVAELVVAAPDADHPRRDAGAAGPTPRAPRRAGQEPRLPELSPRSEIDLRGLRVEEVPGALEPAVDAAVVGAAPWLRIIHGKGTGALRRRVRELLVEDARVDVFRDGEQGEGGHGVTIVIFK